VAEIASLYFSISNADRDRMPAFEIPLGQKTE